MKKSERLLRLLNLLRTRRTAITADLIADKLNVSVRTVYRDIQSLSMTGVPIFGEAGVGYLIDDTHQLPPLMFTEQEALAMMVGSRMVQAFTDPELAQAALNAEAKIRSAMPDRVKLALQDQPYRIPVLTRDESVRDIHRVVRNACESKHKISIDYTDEKGSKTHRILLPLGIIGWLGRWTLLGWCELRNDYRIFRIDRIEQVSPLEETFFTTETLSIKHYYARVLGVKDDEL